MLSAWVPATAGIVGFVALVIVAALASGFGISVSRAALQALPAALAAAVIAGLLILVDREQSA